MKLKPCPFCGNENVEFDRAAGEDCFYSGEISTIFCECGAEVSQLIEHTYDKRLNWENQKKRLHEQSKKLDKKVIRIWNSRIKDV